MGITIRTITIIMVIITMIVVIVRTTMFDNLSYY